MEHRIADTAGAGILDGTNRHSRQDSRANDPTPISRILDVIREMGVVETGCVMTQGLPSYRKLTGDWKVLVVTAVEAEPLLRTSQTFLERWPEKIALGILLLTEVWEPDRIIMALPTESAQRFPVFRRLMKGIAAVEIREVEGWGGMTDERSLVHELFHTPSGNEKIASSPLPGILVESVETMSNIADAVAFSRPVTRHLIACLGEVKEPSNVLADVGMSLRDIIQLCGGSKVGDYRVMIGGPTRAFLETDLDTPVTKSTDAIIVLPRDHPFVEARTRDAETTIRRLKAVCSGCGFCTELCPVHLMGYDLSPHLVVRAVFFDQDDPDEILQSSLLCSECGICELLACSKGLSPRELHRLIKRKTHEKFESDGMQAESLSRFSSASWKLPLPAETAEGRKIPLRRILQLLQLDHYADQMPRFKEAEMVGHVELPLGKPPAKPRVIAGQVVQEGDLIAAEDATGARIHASIDGRIQCIDYDRIVIVRQDG